MPPTQKAPQNKMLPIQKVPQNIWPLLRIDGVSVPATITYRRTHKHSKDVTRHVKPNPSAMSHLNVSPLKPLIVDVDTDTNGNTSCAPL